MVSNVSNILSLINKKKFNSVILNYDETSDNFLKWYQQLVAESLGKKGNGVLPIISTMPKDNHSLMQLYLDGQKKIFILFFILMKNFQKNRFKKVTGWYEVSEKKNLGNILSSQILATKKVFKKKTNFFKKKLINKFELNAEVINRNIFYQKKIKLWFNPSKSI